ncbi:hypothetical protein C3Y87_16150 [Carbonactinospora thermoautotrophica]|uniref:hypothetical protein n=1 Tax=Carbonactinospora thermoautotrophica TaxID=1469144 RepID=UPI00227128D1|nr:hypothetical protein [Carbonactinospora thermoautotrophica]MCX9192918.1 hypothetical protein [Carbonactinospora thermoautotrophica]
MAKYRVEYTPQAKAQYDSLPLLAKAALRALLAKMSRDPWNFGREYPGGKRCCDFAGFGLVVYRVHDDVVVIEVIDITWAK